MEQLLLFQKLAAEDDRFNKMMWKGVNLLLKSIALKGTTMEEITLEEIFEAVSKELARTLAKFSPFHSTHEGYAVILEELDELWAEVKANTPYTPTHKMYKEAIQVAAMAIRFVHDIHRLS